MRVTIGSRRWWLLRALGHNRIVRAVDRVDVLVILAGLTLVLCTAFYCSGTADSIYAWRSHAIAADAAALHRIDATAAAASSADARTAQQSIQRYTVTVEWLAQNVTRETVVKLGHAVEAGDRVPIWIDDQGNATTAPLTDADAHADAVGGAILLWVLTASVIGGAVVIVRRLLDRARYRSWERSLRWLLVDNGGGPTTRTPE